MSQTHLHALDEALHRTAALVTVSEPLLAAIRALVTTGSDQQLMHVNPVEFAKAHGFDKQQTVTAFVGAAKGGVFHFTWSLTCPLCGYYANKNHSLNGVAGTFYCSMCDRVSPVSMDSLVEVAFAVHEAIRSSPGRFGLPLEGGAWLASFKNPSVRTDPVVLDLLARNMVWNGLLLPAADETVAVALPSKPTGVACVTHNTRVTLSCPVGHQGAVVELRDKDITLIEYSKAPGVVIRNRTSREAVCSVAIVVRDEDFSQEPKAPVFEGFLSGRDLLCNQAFRDLFASETLSAGIAMQIESQSVLFTDLKGSTQLYDSIGDLQAFALVSEHFKILLAAVQEGGGAVVKTIGDAVMATFPQMSEAVGAALQMAKTLERFNQSSGLPPLSLKIGVHVGPCIVVSSNGRPDYFGQTVNIAARVQALAEGDELVLTDVAWKEAGVGAQLAKFGLTGAVSDAALKGVTDKVKVHTVKMMKVS